jgi:hypothetical protein
MFSNWRSIGPLLGRPGPCVSTISATFSVSTDLNATKVVETGALKARQMGETEQHPLARLAELSETQAGVVARRQLAELGIGRPLRAVRAAGTAMEPRPSQRVRNIHWPTARVGPCLGCRALCGTGCCSKSSDGRLADRTAVRPATTS